MRVLAEGTTPLEWGGDVDTMHATGQIEPMSGSYAMRWGAGGPALDYGWIGRDAKGVWLKLHPDAALLDCPAVAEVYEALRRHPELTRADQDALAAHDYALAHEFVLARDVLAARRAEGGRHGD